MSIASSRWVRTEIDMQCSDISTTADFVWLIGLLRPDAVVGQCCYDVFDLSDHAATFEAVLPDETVTPGVDVSVCGE